MFIPLILILFNFLAWYPVLSFWFFGGWEQSWLIGICGYHFTFVCLMRGHGILMLVNYILYGWHPTGWYFSAILLHIASVLLIYVFTKFLTKNKLFGFVVALLFGVNVAHNDVINWGSFESLYALLMVGFLLSLFAFFRFQTVKTARRFIWYGMSLLLYLFALFIREVALVLPFFLLITIAYRQAFRITRKNSIFTAKALFPFLLASIGYLFFRNWYGGAPHDFIDGMVQLRIALLGQGKYGEYIFRGLLSFGRFASSHLLPYPLVNLAREIVAKFIYPPLVLDYFFPFVGMSYTFLQLVILWLFRKDKTRNLLLFSFLWYLIPTVFFSFAFTITDYELERPLVWNYTRWRYFAFFGTVLFWVSLGWRLYEVGIKKYKKRVFQVRSVAIGLAVFVLAVNFYFLRNIQMDIYETSFKPAKEFYMRLTKEHKILPNDYVFYYYPYAPGLNDRLAEFYYLRREYYPNLTAERRDWVEGHMGMVLERLEEKKIHRKSLLFFDLDDKGILLDKTKDVNMILSQQNDYLYPLAKTLSPQSVSSLDEKNQHQLTLILDPKLHVEFPYTIEIVASAQPLPQESLQTIPSDQLLALQKYAAERVSMLEHTTIRVCNTAPLGARGAPAMHLLPKNMIDGNLGKRSFWMADCRPAWVALDLGGIKRIGALAFHSEPNGPHVPSEYRIEISKDGQKWEKVLEENNNQQYQRIEKFPKLVDARFVRFTALRTTQGGMLMLDELEVIGEEGLEALDYYSGDFEKLAADSYQYGFPYLRLSWDTDPNNFAPTETLNNNSFYIPIMTDGLVHTYTIQPNEGEFFSAPGQFLKRFITKIHLDITGSPSITEVSSLKISPTFNIFNASAE